MVVEGEIGVEMVGLDQWPRIIEKGPVLNADRGD